MIGGALAFLLLLPVGNLMAVDIGSYTDNSTTIGCTMRSVPRIIAYNLNDSANNSVLNSMLNAGSEYHFYVQISQRSGWGDMRYVNVTAWYDNNDDNVYNYDSISGSNAKFKLIYDTVAGTTSTTGGDVLNAHTRVSAVDPQTKNIEIYFTPGCQIKEASGDGAWNAGPGWNDASSWNFRITAYSVGGTATADDEFGIYNSTYTGVNGKPSAAAIPGIQHTTVDNLLSPTMKPIISEMIWIAAILFLSSCAMVWIFRSGNSVGSPSLVSLVHIAKRKE